MDPPGKSKLVILLELCLSPNCMFWQTFWVVDETQVEAKVAKVKRQVVLDQTAAWDESEKSRYRRYRTLPGADPEVCPRPCPYYEGYVGRKLKRDIKWFERALNIVLEWEEDIFLCTEDSYARVFAVIVQDVGDTFCVFAA